MSCTIEVKLNFHKNPLTIDEAVALAIKYQETCGIRESRAQADNFNRPPTLMEMQGSLALIISRMVPKVVLIPQVLLRKMFW